MRKKSQAGKAARRGLGKKVVGAIASATLALSLTPAAAFASAGADASGGWYDLPSQTRSLDKGSGVTYLSSGIDRLVGGFSQSMYHIMGINGINFDRGLYSKSTHAVSGGRLVSDHVDAVVGLMGTSVNSEPDDYMWNSAVQMYNGKTSFKAKDGLDDDSVYITTRTQGNPSAYEMVSVQYKNEKGESTEAQLPVVIYKEANFISSSDATLKGAEQIAEYVKIENAREGRAKTGAYNPVIATWETNSGGIYYGSRLMYDLAAVVDKATEDSRVNGTAMLMSRYVNANGNQPGKYASATAIAQRYEDFAKATQYYMIRKLNEGTEMKVAAVVCGYQPAKDGQEAAYACRIFDPGVSGEDRNSSAYGGRLANSIMNFTKDINTVLTDADRAFATSANDIKDGKEKVRWYPVSKIVSTADAVFVTDCPEQNRINTYLATNSDGAYSSIYSVDNEKYPAMNQNVDPLVKAADSAKASVYYKYPRHLFGVWYAQGFENCWMAPLAASYLYPDAFTTPENVMAYAAKNFWHINDADVAGVLAATCNDISMTKGATFSAQSADYQSVIDTIMDEGNAYYLYDLEHGAAINAMNAGSDDKGATTQGDLQTYDLNALKARTKATYAGYGIAKGETATVGTGAAACTVKATSATDVTYTAPAKKSTKKVKVPATVTINNKTYNVTKIASKAFKGSKATSITVGDNVATIAKNAFSGASKLKKVVLGKGVAKIGAKAFKNAKKLTKVTIKSDKLTTQQSVKNAFKGSKVATVVVKDVKNKKKVAVQTAITSWGGKKDIAFK